MDAEAADALRCGKGMHEGSILVEVGDFSFRGHVDLILGVGPTERVQT